MSKVKFSTTKKQLALNTSSKPPKYYRHFVDDGFGHFTDKQNATDFLKHINGLTNDLQYTMEYPAADGSIPYLDVLIHSDNTTSVYRKPTHTNLYTHCSSSTPQSSKNSVISSLTRRAHNICSPCHLEAELKIIKHTLLCNGFPLNRINHIMVRTQKNLKTKKCPKKKTTTSANILLPFLAGYQKSIKSTLQRYDISTTFSSPTTLISLLNTNKAPAPKSNTMNTIYKVPCKDCDDYYIGQTCRPLIKRIKEHEACQRLNNFTDSIGNKKSAPAKHSHDMQHTIDWSNTTILTTAADRHQLNLLEHAAISTYNPPMNRQHKGPRVSPLWTPILNKITSDLSPTTADIKLR